MAGVAGSNRQLTLNGVDFIIAADANFSEMGSSVEVDRIPTSGPSVKKITKRVQTVESVVVIADAETSELLRTLDESIPDIPMSYQLANGEVITAVGNIVYENRETEENRASLKLQARDGWTVFTG